MAAQEALFPPKLGDMYKDRSSTLVTDGRGGSGKGESSVYRDSAESKKRVEDVLDKSSPSTSKGGNGRDKERPSAPSTSAARRSTNSDARNAFDKTKYPEDGQFALVGSQVTCVER